MAKAKIYRYQQTPMLEIQPSWSAFGQAQPIEPADADGWEGYWWAEAIVNVVNVLGELTTVRSDELYLIRAEDVEKARSGQEVDLFAPGLYGCDNPHALANYICEQCGGVDDDMFVVIYEGHILHDYSVSDEYAVVFQPIRVLRVYNAKHWFETVCALMR